MGTESFEDVLSNLQRKRVMEIRIAI